MLKNRIVFLLSLAAIVAVTVIGAQNGVSSAVAIPEEINVWLIGLVLAAVTAGFSYVFQYIGLDLREFATPIAGTLSLWVIGELQSLVNTIPDAYDPYVLIGFKIVVVVLSGIGTLYVIAKQRAQGARVESLL